MTNRALSIRILLVYLMGQVASVVMVFIAAFTVPNIATNEVIRNEVSAVILLIMYVGISISLVFLCKTYLIDQARAFYGKTIYHISLSVLAFISLLFAGYFAITLMDMLGIVSDPQNQASLEALAEGKTYLKVILILVTLIFAPIVEELTFRRGIFGLFEKFHVIVPIFVSSFLFGLIHVITDFNQIIPYLFSGIALGIVYVVSNKNVYVVMIGHMLFNLIGILQIFA